MSNSTTKVNIQYKDRLFRLLFGSEEVRENIISLYNALNDTDYPPEHEFDANNINIYGSSLVKIPTPQYIVFYNGTSEMEPVRKLRLSDSFIHPDDENGFEWTATMYNLNRGKNEDLLDKCKPLKDYMTLINYIRDNQALDMPVMDAVDKAVTRCIAEGILTDILKKHRAEVMDVCITEYNEKTFINGIREEGREEGKFKMLVQLVSDGTITVQVAAAKAGMDVTSFTERMRKE